MAYINVDIAIESSDSPEDIAEYLEDHILSSNIHCTYLDVTAYEVNG